MSCILNGASATRTRTRCIRSLLLGSAVTALLTVPAVAQEARGGVLEEVVVTARKRQESILNVPVITTAVSGEQIERLQITNVRAIASLVPGLVMGEQFATSGIQITLRGVGTTTLDPGTDQSVSLNVDGLQMSHGLAFHSGMFDVGQVEVYKGPQSLFYGKSSPGGVISIRTADPTDKFEAIVRAGYEFEGREHQEDYILSGPVNDLLKVRLAVRHSDSEGFFKNDAVALPGVGGISPDDDRVSATRRNMVRGTLLWTPSANLEGRLKLNYVRDRIKWPSLAQLTNCPEGLGTISPGRPYRNPTEECTADRNVHAIGMDPAAWAGIPFNGIPTLDQFQRYGSLEFTYRPTEDLTVTSSTGYYSIRTETMLPSTAVSLYAAPIGSQNDYRRRDWTQELRVNSDYAGPFNFTLGAFVQDGHIHMQVTQRTNALNGFGLAAPLRSAGTHDVKIRSKSAFGQVRYNVTPQIELAAGGRLTDEQRTDTARDLLRGGALVPLVTPELRSKNFSPELTATYKPTDDLTLFASWKKGYKSGSYNITVPAAINGDIAYGDETVKGFEGGVKGRLLDRTVAFSLAGYHYKYTDLQVGALVQPTPGQINLITKTLNAASAKVYGVDFDATWLTPVDGLTVRGAVNWNHARYTKFDNAPCYGGQTVALGCNGNIGTSGLAQTQDLSGLPLVRSADWQGNFGFTFQQPIGGGMTVVVENNNTFTSKYYTGLARHFSVIQGGYMKADLSLTLKGPDDRWELAVAGRNLNNKIARNNCQLGNTAGGLLGLPAASAGQITGGATSGPAGLGETACYLDRGREVWVTATWRPFGR